MSMHVIIILMQQMMMVLLIDNDFLVHGFGGCISADHSGECGGIYLNLMWRMLFCDL